MLVRNRTAADQTDLCVELRKMFLLTTSSEKVFLSRLHQSFAKAAIVNHGISLSLRTEPREIHCCEVSNENSESILKTRHPRAWESFCASSTKRQRT